MMKQLQFYKYATWLLLILNIALIAFILFMPSGPKHKKDGLGAGDLMKFDEQQNKQFLELAQEHIGLMESINSKQKVILKSYFNNLIDQMDSSAELDSLLASVQQLEGKKITSTYQHFQDIKSILRPDQQEGYKEFVKHTMARLLLDEPKEDGPPERRK